MLIEAEVTEKVPGGYTIELWLLISMHTETIHRRFKVHGADRLAYHLYYVIIERTTRWIAGTDFLLAVAREQL